MHLLTCCFGCLTLLGCQSSLLRHRAFFPPDPPTYSIQPVSGGLHLKVFDQDDRPIQWLSEKVLILQTDRNQRIPALWFRHVQARLTILFSHGNSCDIGEMRNYVIELATQLRANVLLYEYTGYGLSTGRPSEQNMQADIKAAYWYLRNVQKIGWEEIMAFGQSVGTGPTCFLASEFPVGCIVLQSPIASGLRLYSKVKRSHWFDPFNNFQRATHIQCPAFVMHGEEDDVVPIKHAKLVHSRLKMAAPGWWVPHADHTNIDTRYKQEFFERLKEFVDSVRNFQRFISEKDLQRSFYPTN